jgi:hypothetical protein
MSLPDPAPARPTISDLRLHISRQRRRVDARLLATRRELHRLRSWRTYVQHFPGKAMIAAFGLALAGTAAVRGKRMGRRAGAFLVRKALNKTVGGLWGELRSLLISAVSRRPTAAGQTPDDPGTSAGANHART